MTWMGDPTATAKLYLALKTVIVKYIIEEMKVRDRSENNVKCLRGGKDNI